MAISTVQPAGGDGPARRRRLHGTSPSSFRFFRLPVYVELGDCLFPESGLYNFEVYFAAPAGGETLKGEHPFVVISHED
jgi:hypothetical protein